jgi:hypothetical protein
MGLDDQPIKLSVVGVVMKSVVLVACLMAVTACTTMSSVETNKGEADKDNLSKVRQEAVLDAVGGK